MERLDVVGLLVALRQLERNVSISLMYSGVRTTQYRLLDLIDGDDQATVTQLSRKLNITRASASVMINELIKDGVLRMEENPADRRSFHLQLTASGRNKLQVARADLSVLCDKLSKRYSEEMVRSLNRFAETVLTG